MGPVQFDPAHEQLRPGTRENRNDALVRHGGSLDRGQVLPVVQDEHGGVIGVEHVLMLKSPARRSRAGLGVRGVAGMVSLSR